MSDGWLVALFAVQGVTTVIVVGLLVELQNQRDENRRLRRTLDQVGAVRPRDPFDPGR